MNISLIGYMGSGKTSVAQLLAKMLDHACIEMDREALSRAGTADMKELFTQKGEVFLRELEISLAKEFSSKKNTIISTGGGVVLNKIITDYLKKDGGVVIFLHAPFETLADRIEKDPTPRPNFQDRKQAHSLYKFRLPLYKQYADIIIRTKGKTVEHIAQEIVLKIYKTKKASTEDISPLKTVVDQILKIRKV